MNITVNNYEEDESKKKKESSNGGKILLVFTIAAMIGAIAYVGFVKEPKSAYDVAVENGFNGTEAEWLESLKGSNGTNGENGTTPTIEINSDGYWVINGQVTTIKAQGDKGEQGDAGSAGSNGTNGTTPTVEINSDGYWVVNGVATSIKAQGDKGNAGTDGQDGANGSSIAEQTIANLNTKLAAITESLSSYPTVYERLNAANISSDSLNRLTRNYLYSYIDNKFICIDDAGYVAYTVEGTNYQKADLCLSDANLYQFSDSSSLSTNYSNYIISGTATTITTNKSLDVGNNTYIESVSYVSTTTDEGNIRLNGGDLTINAPNATVNHYGSIDHLNIIAVANASYHEFGSVATTKISTGRVVIEDGGQMEAIHLSKTEGEFKNIVISVDEHAELPIITRDEVGTTITGDMLVCEIEKGNNQSDYIFLTGDGTQGNIKVVSGNSGEKPTDTTEFKKVDDVDDTTTLEVIGYLANKDDGAGNISDSGKTTEEVEAFSKAVAKIGTNFYDSIASAYTSAGDNDNNEITLLVSEVNLGILETLDIEKTITIKGHEGLTIVVNQEVQVFNVKENGSLTFDGVVFDGQAKFTRIRDEIRSSCTITTDNTNRKETFINVRAGGALSITNSTFKGFDYSNATSSYYGESGHSIIRAYGTSNKTTTVDIDNVVFEGNVGQNTTLLALDSFITATMNDTLIKDNLSVNSSNAGFVGVRSSDLTVSGNTEICGNSYNGNGMFMIIGTKDKSASMTIENINIHDNYGGKFTGGAYAVNGNGRCGILYVHTCGSLTFNKGIVANNYNYSLVDYSETANYRGPVDPYSGGTATISEDVVFENNRYYYKDGVNYRVVIQSSAN